MASHQSSSSPASPKPSSMTKEMLRNALIQHGVPLPDRSALKEELVRLYQEYVVNSAASQGEFSSDDEVDGSQSADGLRLNFQADEVTPYVKGLSNAQLYQYLKFFEVTSGPVVATTRTLYENQVARLLAQKASSPVTNGASHATEGSNGRNGFSDSDDDAAVETASRASRSSRASGIQQSSRTPPPTPSKRRQVRVSSTRQVVASNSVSQPAVNTSTGHLLSEPEDRQSRRSSARNTPTSDLADDGGGGGENVRHIPVQLSIFPRYGTPGTPVPSPSTASRQSRDLASSLSYFRERPGFASTTTSNVLPHKPSYSRDNSGEASKAKGDVLQSMSTARRRVMFIAAFCVVIIAIFLFTKMTSDHNAVRVSDSRAPDELDDILADLADEKNGI